MAKNWRQTKDYRLWRIRVIRRDTCCIICGSKNQRQAHHLENGKHNPELRFDVDNGVTLCRKCHTSFHTDYKKSFRHKTTEDDFQNFLKIIIYAHTFKLNLGGIERWRKNQ